MPEIITVAAAKGGVGKTTLAYELAAALGGLLVDLDWDGGGATRMWGYDPAAYQRAPLLDALERGPEGFAPTPKRRNNQPALIPSHPDLGSSSIPASLVADCLRAWSSAWSVPYIVVDTHPGANELTHGALEVTHLVVIPAVLGMRELDALERMMVDFAKFPRLLVPNMVPTLPSRPHHQRLRTIAGTTPVSQPISEHRWLRRRLRRSAVTLQPNPGRQVRRAADEYRAVAAAVEEVLHER